MCIDMETDVEMGLGSAGGPSQGSPLPLPLPPKAPQVDTVVGPVGENKNGCDSGAVPTEIDEAVQEMAMPSQEFQLLLGTPSADDADADDTEESASAVDEEIAGSEVEPAGRKPEEKMVLLREEARCSGQEKFFCYICFEEKDPCSGELDDVPFRLTGCGHSYCFSCLERYLQSKVEEGDVAPRCFFPIDPMAASVSAAMVATSALPVPPEARSSASSSSQPSYPLSTLSTLSAPPSAPALCAEEPFSPTFQSSSRSVTSQTAPVELPVARMRRSGGRSGGMMNSSNHSVGASDGAGGMTMYRGTCRQTIIEADIESVISLSGNAVLRTKYRRFKFFHDEPNGRECPFPGCRALCVGNPEQPEMTCMRCNGTFCFVHANAHPGSTCEEYEQRTAAETKQCTDFISHTSKPCPRCGKMITKGGGCNHMRCVCGAAFCWVCGKEIEDTVFPRHFQWWNANGCANMQMNNEIEPTTTSLTTARALSLLQIMVLGPLSLVSTCVGALLCPCCLPLFYDRTLPPNARLCDLLTNCLSFWGLFYTAVIVILPFALLVGVFIVAVCLALYPLYAVLRLANKQYPWPDAVTDCCRECNRSRRHARQRPDPSLFAAQRRRSLPPATGRTERGDGKGAGALRKQARQSSDHAGTGFGLGLGSQSFDSVDIDMFGASAFSDEHLDYVAAENDDEVSVGADSVADDDDSPWSTADVEAGLGGGNAGGAGYGAEHRVSRRQEQPLIGIEGCAVAAEDLGLGSGLAEEHLEAYPAVQCVVGGTDATADDFGGVEELKTNAGPDAEAGTEVIDGAGSGGDVDETTDGIFTGRPSSV